MHLQLLHESLTRFSESFASFLYGLNMNAFCVDFPEVQLLRFRIPAMYIGVGKTDSWALYRLLFLIPSEERNKQRLKKRGVRSYSTIPSIRTEIANAHAEAETEEVRPTVNDGETTFMWVEHSEVVQDH